MGLTSSLFTGLTGLNSNQFRIDTIGNNVANMNTTAYKASRSTFQNQFAMTYSAGSPPNSAEGGSNPVQIGLGSVLGSVMRVHTSGSIETTGVSTDLAIEGNGFFILSKADNKQAYTRDGTMMLNSANYLVSQDGFYVQGFGVDEDWNVIPGVLQNLRIPVGTMSIASATESAKLDGNIDAGGTVGTQGSVLTSQEFWDLGAGAAAGLGTLLTDVAETGPPIGPAVFAVGDTVTITGEAKKGGRDLAEASFTVGAATTLEDYLTWLDGVFGLNQNAAAPGTLLDDTIPASLRGSGWYVSTGAAGEPPAGTIYVVGNHGEDNGLTIGAAGIQVDSGGTMSVPFSFSEQKAADGESIFTSFITYDSLGKAVEVDLTLVMETKNSDGVEWRWYAESAEDTGPGRMIGAGPALAPDPDRFIGQGTIQFDQLGQHLQSPDSSVMIDRDNTGAADPMSITIDFTDITCLTTGANAGAGNPTQSVLVMTTQDGFPAGTLRDFSVSADGTIIGTFTNGLQRTLGQVALANFSNPEGLVAETNNTYALGPNSGVAIITAPLTLGSGRIMSGALELSNVDLSREFIGLVTASTGFSASGRIISTSDELMRELLTMVR
ncbi:MAG: flagellar hook-basal body complex protein [Phycisphaerae bacterium]|nr:flagellar hook-basal body complex protein [Phycisphaerae bacterium]